MSIPMIFKGETSEPLIELTKKKLTRLSHHYDNISNIEVTFTVEHQTQTAAITLSTSTPHTHAFHAHAATEDMYTSVDQVIQKIERQLEKLKEKTTRH